MNMHGEYLKAFARYSRQRLSGKEWEALLRNAEEMGISQLQITEASGCAVFDFVSDRVRKGAKILILCGTGFLGGCGFAAARYLCTEYNIAVATIGAKAGYSDAAMKNRFILQHLPSVGVLYDAADEAGKFASDADVIIDALADIKEGDAELGRIVMQVNRHKKKGCKVISLDRVDKWPLYYIFIEIQIHLIIFFHLNSKLLNLSFSGTITTFCSSKRERRIILQLGSLPLSGALSRAMPGQPASAGL